MSTNNAIERVKKYLVERAKMQRIHPEEIHNLHAGDDQREATLLVADLNVLLAILEVTENKRILGYISASALESLRAGEKCSAAILPVANGEWKYPIIDGSGIA